ncbi:hypothetical protein Trco_003382 [Trichoderma cornu-damae]|uniref:Endoplasmic reticulum junction formation protein lunapark n=1 Tax=Trichoderma cornu-damae TaxID=654480 RepID=A0A9P8TVY1_9HYPO|nr:hypothetical protein Trco_003382 [Trichoderma cornu-damae]
MVSFWPWKSDDSSPASFERALSALSKKITTTQTRLEWTRLRSRKIKVLGTLYTSFAYLVSVIVLFLVVGYPNLGPWEWTGMAGGPVFIYTTRVVITGYYNFRIDSLEAKLKALQEERNRTIQKLKDATKYDSTMELIEKYGGPDGRPRSRQQQEAPDDFFDAKKAQPPAYALPDRIHISPPPTANIPRREFSPASLAPSSRPVTPLAQSVASLDTTADFAPNAFGHPPPRPQSAQSQLYGMPPPPPSEPHWYDRIFDVLLGEDETAAKNRIVLICRVCRLVNGQAPPGTKSLGELGMWKCMACGTPNGEMDEGKRIVREVLKSHEKEQDASSSKEPTTPEADEGDKQAEDASTENEFASPQVDGPAAAVKARRSARSKK